MAVVSRFPLVSIITALINELLKVGTSYTERRYYYYYRNRTTGVAIVIRLRLAYPAYGTVNILFSEWFRPALRPSHPIQWNRDHLQE